MTGPQQERFLTELRHSGNIAFACRAAGVTRSQALADRDTSKAFQGRWAWAARLAREALEERIAG